MTREAKRARDRHAASIRRWKDRLREEALAGERPANSIPKVNRKRKAKLYARNFGDKADWIRGLPCEVTGVTRTTGHDIDPAHMEARGMGGCGGDLTVLVPLWRPVHRSYDTESEAQFLATWGRTKESVRVTAREYHDEWLRQQAQEAA